MPRYELFDFKDKEGNQYNICNQRRPNVKTGGKRKRNTERKHKVNNKT